MWTTSAMTVNMSEAEPDHINCTISHEIHQYLFSVAYILVLLIGVPTNAYSLYHAWLQLRDKNELGIYLLNLTVSDLLYLASLPLWLQYIFQGDDWRQTEWLCQLCGFLLYENIYVSIGFLCCISIDRYLAVVYPFRFTAFRSMRAATLASAFIWLKEIAVGVVFFKHKELSRDSTNQSVCFEHYPMQPWEYPINYYRFAVGFLFPLGILSVSYLRVLRAVGKSVGTQSTQKTRIKNLVTSTIVIFLVCFSPYHVFLLVRTILERDCPFIINIFNYYHVSLLLTSFNCVADPALYCFVSERAQQGIQQAQEACTQALCYCCHRGQHSPITATGTDSEVATSNENRKVSVTLLASSSNINNTWVL
ncbi:ovarian cancer G-protein coupled receptor 1 [Salmo salar]|uniref:Ovarian cancer G-protein coupled receptor 1 n=1 Tax=Salmo salar TaxID=8030 RepID=A0A1S3RB04_SALSA|nr:ovarian cancer G-protein coupled receptor 1 [Salmo salar]XP_014048923.2 ovarian cancer G-protein coupled receptor 1 [Salmo salar]XP_014048933.2 ovarian cancer G-protein coupled receptor 1 [Salmo salar]XP_014048940.2 ovarian cancer G-protein coupled receptor 1 [Salmo salar]